MTLVIVIGALLAIALLLGMYIVLGGVGLLLVLGLAVVVLSFIQLFRSSVVLINETEIGVVFDKTNGNFSRFIDSARHPHYNYHHLLNPFKERLESKILKGSQRASGEATQIRTREGIPVSIGWAVSFSVDPFKIKPGIGLEPKMARALPHSATKMVGGKTVLVLKHIVEQKSINELYGANALKSLEAEVREEVIKRTEALGITGISADNVQLGPIIVPPQVEKALEAAHERKLQTETAVTALERLKEVVHGFNQTDMDRLAELERLRVIGESGASPVYLMPSLIKQVEASRADINGLSIDEE